MSKSSVTIHQAGDAWVRLGRPRVSLEQLRLGMEVEQEHTDDLFHAAEIAVDHLSEFGDYYTRLVKMEERARAGMPPNPMRANPGRMTSRQAFEKLFDALEDMFPDFGTLTLVEDDSAHDGGRHYAYCAHDWSEIEIAFAGQADEDLRPEHMEAMMAHEMGHALDYRYGKRGLERALDVSLSGDAELRADEIAEAVFGFPISYDVKCGYVQTKNKGVYPRPKGLR